MFVVQVRFLDSQDKPETVILRRLHAVIGSRETSHLIIDGASSLSWELRLRRGIGTRFFIQKVDINKDEHSPREEKEYSSFCTVTLGVIEFFIYCIDPKVSKHYLDKADSQLDLVSSDMLVSNTQLFPVIYSVKEPKVALSISCLERFYIGRSRKCLFRLENKQLLAEHLEVFQVAEVWYVKSLGTDQQFRLNGKSLVDKVAIKSGDRLSCGDAELIYLDSEADLNTFSQEIGYSLSENSNSSSGYLTLLEGPGAPQKFPLVDNNLFTIGRDPSHSLWIDKYFVSRLHCTILLRGDSVEITDYSSNGTTVDGRKLKKGSVEVFKEPSLDVVIGPGVRLSYKVSTIVEQLDLPLSKEVMAVYPENDVLNGQSLKSEETPGISDEMSGSSQEVTFTEYQRRTLRQMEESGNYEMLSAPFIAGSKLEDREEVPIQIGLSRFLPQVFIGMLIIILSIIFVVIAKNIIF
jgi:pSer/pThr/pTyr-binding forkhead associated (FHA) protein